MLTAVVLVTQTGKSFTMVGACARIAEMDALAAVPVAPTKATAGNCRGSTVDRAFKFGRKFEPRMQGLPPLPTEVTFVSLERESRKDGEQYQYTLDSVSKELRDGRDRIEAAFKVVQANRVAFCNNVISKERLEMNES